MVALTINLFVFVIVIFDCGEVNHGYVGEQQTVFLQVFITGEENSIEHGLVKKEVAHPFGDDYIIFLDGKLNLLELALHKCDFCWLHINS